MNMTKFTGEASLYQTNGQYRTGRQVIHSLPRTISPITPAVIQSEVPIDVPGEDIPLHSCAPGWIDIGGSCWPAPMTESSSGGSSGSPGGGSPGSGPGGGGGGGGPMTPPEKPLPKPWAEKVGLQWHHACVNADGRKWLECCGKKVTKCIDEANKNPKREAECVDAGEWCKGRNPRDF
jgi:hypothetical protein